MSGETETPSIIIRDIDNIPEMRDVESLEREVWGCDDLDIVPLTMLAAARESGGILIGAFDGDAMVGFAFGFVGYEGGETVHHSHMLAVRSEYRKHDLGFRLKLAQRERALEQGIKIMTWTFDPLQSLNAHFNFGKLGVVADKYKVNFYGETTSSPLHQTGTDRLLLTWLLDSSRVHKRIDQRISPEIYDDRLAKLVRCTDTGVPERDVSSAGKPESFGIEIPRDISSIERTDPNLARSWRAETRRVFQEAITEGFVVTDYARRTDGVAGGVYLLKRGNLSDFG